MFSRSHTESAMVIFRALRHGTDITRREAGYTSPSHKHGRHSEPARSRRIYGLEDRRKSVLAPPSGGVFRQNTCPARSGGDGDRLGGRARVCLCWHSPNWGNSVLLCRCSTVPTYHRTIDPKHLYTDIFRIPKRRSSGHNGRGTRGPIINDRTPHFPLTTTERASRAARHVQQRRYIVHTRADRF
jgi:hypothetical protein